MLGRIHTYVIWKSQTDGVFFESETKNNKKNKNNCNFFLFFAYTIIETIKKITIMKTKIMKVAIFMMIMAGMLESMVGYSTFAVGQTCEIAFSSDTSNVNGWAYGEAFFDQSQINCFLNFKNPVISAIGGDVLFMKSILFDSIASDTVVDWVVLDGYNIVKHAKNVSSFSFELSTYTPIQPFNVYCVPANTLDTATFYESDPNVTIIMYSLISAKFVQSVPNVVLDTTAKSSTLLNIGDFGVRINQGISADGSYFIFNSVRWYRDGVLLLIDDMIQSINPADYGSGDYSIEVKNTFVTVFAGDTVQHEGVWSQRSNSIQVDLGNVISINGDYNSIQTSIFENELIVPNVTIYPNPVKTMLNISEEIEYSIFSITGQMILSGYGKEIDVSYFKPGMYFLRTINESHKFIVE